MIAETARFWQEVKDLTTNVYIPSLIWKDLWVREKRSNTYNIVGSENI